MTWWHLHRWTRWRNFTHVTYGVLPGDPPHYQYVTGREAMQEKTCRTCGKIRQRKV